jgi:hypothetical protein
MPAPAVPRPGAPGPSGSMTGPTSSIASCAPRQMTGDTALLEYMESDDSGGDVDEEAAIEGAVIDQPIIRALLRVCVNTPELIWKRRCSR